MGEARRVLGAGAMHAAQEPSKLLAGWSAGARGTSGEQKGREAEGRGWRLGCIDFAGAACTRCHVEQPAPRQSNKEARRRAGSAWAPPPAHLLPQVVVLEVAVPGRHLEPRLVRNHALHTLRKGLGGAAGRGQRRSGRRLMDLRGGGLATPEPRPAQLGLGWPGRRSPLHSGCRACPPGLPSTPAGRPPARTRPPAGSAAP